MNTRNGSCQLRPWPFGASPAVVLREVGRYHGALRPVDTLEGLRDIVHLPEATWFYTFAQELEPVAEEMELCRSQVKNSRWSVSCDSISILLVVNVSLLLHVPI